MPGGPFGLPGSPPSGSRGHTFTVELANEVQFKARMRTYKAGVKMQAERMVAEVAREIAETARDLSPVDTGKTRDNIRPEKRDEWVVVSDRGGERPEVPIYLETGTYKMAARPTLRPASDMVTANRGWQRAAKSVGGLLGPARF